MADSFYQQAHRLRDGAVVVYRRADTNQQVYQARLKVPGVSGYIIRSLKIRDLPTALNQAEDLFYDLKAVKSRPTVTPFSRPIPTPSR